MNVVLRFLSMIPVKMLVSNLPRILGFILTKVMQYLASTNPDKLKHVIETSRKVIAAMEITLEAGADNVFESHELEDIAKAWKDAL